MKVIFITGRQVFVTAMLNYFDWKHVAIVFDYYDVLMRIQGEALTNALRADSAFARPFSISFDTTKNPDLRSFLLEVIPHTRVIFFLSSGGDLRRFMLEAESLGMTNGEYVFITIELFPSIAWGDFSWERGDADDARAKSAYEALLFVTLTTPSGPKWRHFVDEVMQRAASDYNYTYTSDDPVNYFVGAFYDGVKYLTLALNQTLEDGEDPYDGLRVAQKRWNTTFQGIMGEVYVDEIGDRIADYSLLDMTDVQRGEYQIVAKYKGSTRVMALEPGTSIRWPRGSGPPPDVPKCGFSNEAPGCQPKDNTMPIAITFCVSCVVLIMSALIGSYLYRRRKFEHALLSDAWRVDWDDIVLNKNPAAGSTSRISMALTIGSSGTLADGGIQIFTTIGHYKGVVVAIRKIKVDRIDLSRNVLLELKMMRELAHNNLTRFIGACVTLGQNAILNEYCTKGSLQDILANESIQLDWLFRYSLVNDIIGGMLFLHSSEIGVHGRLKSSNCVVDSRFVLKLTDYGLPTFYQPPASKESRYAHHKQQFWSAPETLKEECYISKEADVYGFGVILHEVITREEPYSQYDLNPKDVIGRVLKKENPPFRPRTDRSLCVSALYDVMESCWNEAPSHRPYIRDIREAFKKINKESKSGGGILDNLISRLEQYAENLEALVEDRTQAFLDEKRKSEELLYRVLPKSVAEQLKQGRTVEPESYACVTIYFSDIVGFTALSAASTPFQVVNLLNDLYTTFDAIIDNFDVYKVETIGDAYMVVSGLPIKNGNEHAAQISRMSLALLKAIRTFKIRHLPSERLKLRIGLHSGPCVAGVVGLTMPRYCLFGDTVNTASRLESTGEAMKIHVSPFTKDILDAHGSFILSLRGETSMKGKGTLTTWWLEGELAAEIDHLPNHTA